MKVYTVESPTGCRCCGDEGCEVRVFSQRKDALRYAEVEGGKVHAHKVADALPPEIEWVKMIATVREDLTLTTKDGQPFVQVSPTYETLKDSGVTGRWANKDGSPGYEQDGMAWRGIFPQPQQYWPPRYVTVELWAPDTDVNRQWFHEKLADVLANFDTYAALARPA